MSNVLALHGRHRAYLRAVAAGRAEMTNSREPDLYIDGLPVTDQFTAHQLAEAGYLCPQTRGTPGERVPADLSEYGTTVLAA